MGITLRTRALVLSLLLATCGLSGLGHAQCTWSDDFDSYAAGSFISGQGGWIAWDQNPAADAELVSGQAPTPPIYLNMTADADIVRELPAVNSGVWRVSAYAQVPSGMTGTLWWIILNTYQSGGPYNWSCQVGFSFNTITGEIEADDAGGSTFAGNGITNLGALADEWFAIRTDIDFDQNLYHSWIEYPIGSGVLVDVSGIDRTWAGGSGVTALGGLDLYSTATPAGRYDAVAVEQIDAIGGSVFTGGQCSPFDAVTATTDCSTGDVTLDWGFLCPTTPAPLMDILRDGVVVADDIPGDSGPFVDPAVPSGTYTYTLISDCGESFDYSVSQSAYGGETDLVIVKDLGGRHTDAAALIDSLVANGRTVLIGDLTDPCFPDPTTNDFVVWVSLGTFPDDGQLTTAEGQALADLNVAGIPVYLEGGDHWGFHPDTAWREYDGVDQDLVEDGDDSADWLTGLDSTLGLDLSNHAAFYYQDQDGFEWTDRLSPVTPGMLVPDLGGDLAATIWETTDENPPATYGVGIFYDSTFAPVISSSWEFAGFTGDRNALMAQYLEALTGVAASCVAPGPLSASSDCVSGDLTLSWGGTHDGYEVFRDGVSVATYPSGATEHLETALPSGIYVYEVVGTCGGDSASATIEVVHQGGGGADHVVVRSERLQGAIDSAAAIFDALVANGESAMIVESLEDPCFPTGSGATIWVCLGTWPTNHVLTDVEADVLVIEHTTGGSKVYLEGPDHWIDPVTNWAAYDGCDIGADGDDSFIAMIGLDSTFGLDVSALGAAYNQDMDGNDFTDQLTPAVPGLDLGGDNAAAIWQDDTGLYNTGVHYASAFGDVLSISWEFGGYAGDQNALMATYLGVMGVGSTGPEFIRGDANGDGGYDISDAIYTLSALFVFGSPPPACVDSGDSNDDGGFDISDAIYTLSALFVFGSPPPVAPHPDCGEDPTADSLDCASYAPCP